MKNLRKILLAVVLFVGTTTFASASAFDKGVNILGPHIGYGGYGLNAGLWYEHGVHKYVGIGVQGDFTWLSYGYTGTRYNILGVRAMFTLAGHIPIRQVPNLDIFIKLGLGYGLAAWPSDYNPYGKSGAYLRHYFAWELTVGIRYFFTQKVGVRVEVGYPSWIKAGVDFKF